MEIKDRIFYTGVKLDQLRSRSPHLKQASAGLNRQGARLRALSPFSTVHLVEDRFDDSVTFAGAFSQGTRVFDRETPASIAD